MRPRSAIPLPRQPARFENGRVIEERQAIPVVSQKDVVVVGGGPAGVTAATAAARAGASVSLVERYAFLGGMASGGMVLVLDDMANGMEVTVGGLCGEFIDRLERVGAAVSPPREDWGLDPAALRRWTRWGFTDMHARGMPKPIVYTVSFDPDGWKRVSNDLIAEAGVELRLHHWFAKTIMDGDRVVGVVCETKLGRVALMGDVVIDATGDGDVIASAGAEYMSGSYMVTPVFRLGGVRVEDAERFEEEHPAEAAKLQLQARRVLGGAWSHWWLRTTLPGIVWCNCPHLNGLDATDPLDLTRAELEGRRTIAAFVEHVRQHIPGFSDAYVVDVAPQIGVRQSRMVVGDYVVTKADILQRRHFADSVARGRGYYTPYRALLPRGLDGILVAGRNYSAEPEAQRVSREIPPCMTMGEAAGNAAVMSREYGNDLRQVPVGRLQQVLRANGADPGDVPSANATIEEVHVGAS